MRTNSKILLQFSIIVFALLASCEESMDEEKPIVMKAKSEARPQRLASNYKNYKFTGNEGDPIDYQVARKWVANYQAKENGGNVAHFFGYEIIKDILALEGSMGIRMYYALDDQGQRQIILVGVDENGENITPSENGRKAGEGVVVDASYPCPSYCSGGGNPL
ncbi:MAG: hypothetical protein JNM57_01295 [Cyclobacteriaceae bacterium]|nr:hypothetical protein [Cyclobacteriaceae bacterium]